ncbi:MAG: HNH endonuclease [Candidatus Rokubacteria bacterium]|nr:HNH endonuclease [Candidatus Rokubacteria bacterium]
MSAYTLTHLPDAVLLRGLTTLAARDRVTTAQLLAHLAEADARQLYLPAAHPSMFSYCVHELRFSEDAALKRIQAARVARQFPATFPLLAEGRLHLCGVVLLAPHLNEENADELLAAAAGKTKAEIVRLLAGRLPRPDFATQVGVLAAPASPVPATEPAPGHVQGSLVPGESPAPGRLQTPSACPPAEPLAPQRYGLHFTVEQEAYDDLRCVQELLGHPAPERELPRVFGRAIKLLRRELEKAKRAGADRPRAGRPSTNPRHIPAKVRRTVWERDGGQCTYVSEAGRRCPARSRLEWDHVEPVARGGQATVENGRLRCRGHNQYAAEQAFGADFMRHKREEARRGAEARRKAGEERRAAAEERQRAAEEVITPLRLLGCSADQARAAAALCEGMAGAPLEQRIRAALSYLVKPLQRRAARVLQASP